MGKAVAVRVDSKFRVTIPAEAREALGVQPGTMLFLEREGDVLHLAKAENPFDGLAQHAIEEYKAGRTKSLLEAADEFDREVAMLGQSEKFMQFLAERSKEKGTISLDRLKQDLDQQAGEVDGEPV